MEPHTRQSHANRTIGICLIYELSQLVELLFEVKQTIENFVHVATYVAGASAQSAFDWEAALEVAKDPCAPAIDALDLRFIAYAHVLSC